MSSSIINEIFNDLHEMCVTFYDMYKSIKNRYRMYIFKKRGFKGYDYNIFNLVRGLKVKKYIIMLLLFLTFVVSFNVSASGVGDLEIEPLYEPTMTFVNDNLGKFNYNPFLRRLKTDVLENENNFLGVDTLQSYDEVINGGNSELVNLKGATVTLSSGWSASAAYGTFNYLFDFTVGNFSYSTCYAVAIGYENNYSDDFPTIDPHINSIAIMGGGGFYSIGPFYNNDILIFEFTDSYDITNSALIQWFLDNNAIIEGGIYEGGESIEEVTFSLSELYNRNQNFTHSNYWGISSNYVTTNQLSMANNRGVDSIYLDYSNIVIYDEFIINYSQNNYTLIPTSIIVDISTIDNIIWEWNYKVQTDIGLTEVRSQSWTLDSQYMRDNKINVLPQNPLYNVTTNQMSEFINTYGQNQFINLSSARVTINFNTNVNEFDIIQYSVDKNVYDEFNELAWYDFDSQGSVSNLGESLLDSANSFLQLEIFPNFRILDILLIAIAIPMLIWVLKVFFGG